MTEKTEAAPAVELRWVADEYSRAGRALLANGVYAGCIVDWGRSRASPWRAWCQAEPEEHHVGWFATDAEAKTALEAHIITQVGAPDLRAQLDEAHARAQELAKVVAEAADFLSEELDDDGNPHHVRVQLDAALTRARDAGLV